MIFFLSSSASDFLTTVKENKLKESTVNKKAFALGFIQKRHQNNMIEQLNKLEQAIIKQDYDKVEEIKAKVYEDFRKYHILQKPDELLESFILSHSSDSKLNPYKETYKTLLLRGLNFAKLNEVQELLMEAVSDGVAINIKNQFDNYNVNYLGYEFSMASNEVISYMVNSLVLDGQIETALLFVDKLGLSDIYVKNMYDSFDFDELRKAITDSHIEATNFNNFKNELDVYIKDVSKILNDTEKPNLGKLLRELKKTATELAVNHGIPQENLKIFLNTLRNIQYTCKENPDAQKGIIFDSLVNTAKAQMVNMVTNNIAKRDDILEGNSNILKLINQLVLSEDSDAFKLRAEINTKFSELADYKNYLVGLHK